MEDTERQDLIEARSLFLLPAVSCLLPMLLALIHPLARVFGRLDWRVDLFTHFSEPALAVTVVALVAVARRRRLRWLMMGLAGLAGFQGAALLRYEWGNPVAPDPRSPTRVRILMTNVLRDNDRYDALARLIRHERPDIVGLVEFGPGWPEGLAAIRREFPYRVEAPTGAGGLALWFRADPCRSTLLNLRCRAHVPVSTRRSNTVAGPVISG